MNLKQNMAIWDRVARASVATVVILLAATGVISGWLMWVLLVVSAVLVVVSFIGSCPLYLPFGISTKNLFKSNKNKN